MSGEANWSRGYVQVYTGDGKGKTTAALGLALRAAGAGLKVYFTQFCKGRDSSEHAALQRVTDLITWSHSGSTSFIMEKPTPEDIAQAEENLRALRKALVSGDYRLVIADELNVAVDLGLVTVDQALELIEARPENVELVLTGRNAPPEIVMRADLVTEMLAVKHPYREGVQARRGIEY
jgi:cob(I)alamin adenosyltransferase